MLYEEEAMELDRPEDIYKMARDLSRARRELKETPYQHNLYRRYIP